MAVLITSPFHRAESAAGASIRIEPDRDGFLHCSVSHPSIHFPRPPAAIIVDPANR